MMKHLTKSLILCLSLAVLTACGKLPVASAHAATDRMQTISDPESRSGAVETTTAKKLRVGILGDSISTFKGIISGSYLTYYPKSGGDVDSWEKTYWGLLINRYWDAELDVNSSWSGSCVAPGCTGKTAGSDFVSRSNDFVNPDIILIHGGTNDSDPSTSDVQLGDFDFVSSFDELDKSKRFRDSYIAVIRNLQKNYPDAQIIIIIGDHCFDEYGRSVKAIAEFFDLPCVDFTSDAGVTKFRSSHPDAAGMEYMARKIYNQTKDIVELCRN